MTSFYKIRHYRLMIMAVACLTVTLSSTSMAQGGLQRHSEELAAIAEQVNPAVVSIFAAGRDVDVRERGHLEQVPQRLERFFREWRPHGEQPFEFFKKEGEVLRFAIPRSTEERTRRGIGTGIIVDREGHIVTASHIVDGSRGKIKVKLADGQEFEAEMVGADPDSGVAVVKIDAEDLTPANPGNSDNVRVGELVLAFGNLRRRGITISMGIVGATGRTGLDIITYEDFIQIDAMIGPGSSGGPLVNAQGEVIGMIIAAFADEGSSMGPGLAVPMNTVLEVMDDLVSEGKVKRGWLGVQIQEVNAELAEKMGLEKPRGALVVGASGPAKEGGIESGDVITELDGTTIEDFAHLRNTVARTEPGKDVAVTVMRKGEEKKLTVKLGERTEESVATLNKRRAAPKEVEWMGITVQELSRELAEELEYEGEDGVLISHVRQGSPAHKKELQNGDLIQEVDHKSIRTMRDYEEAMESAGDSVLLRLRRGDRVWYEVIKAEGK